MSRARVMHLTKSQAITKCYGWPFAHRPSSSTSTNLPEIWVCPDTCAAQASLIFVHVIGASRSNFGKHKLLLILMKELSAPLNIHKKRVHFANVLYVHFLSLPL